MDQTQNLEDNRWYSEVLGSNWRKAICEFM
jgi:hypothetical protein